MVEVKSVVRIPSNWVSLSDAQLRSLKFITTFLVSFFSVFWPNILYNLKDMVIYIYSIKQPINPFIHPSINSSIKSDPQPVNQSASKPVVISVIGKCMMRENQLKGHSIPSSVTLSLKQSMLLMTLILPCLAHPLTAGLGEQSFGPTLSAPRI